MPTEEEVKDAVAEVYDQVAEIVSTPEGEQALAAAVEMYPDHPE